MKLLQVPLRAEFFEGLEDGRWVEITIKNISGRNKEVHIVQIDKVNPERVLMVDDKNVQALFGEE